MVVVAHPGDLLPQGFVVTLHAVIGFVDAALFAAQAPKMERAALADDGDER